MWDSLGVLFEDWWRYYWWLDHSETLKQCLQSCVCRIKKKTSNGIAGRS
jgi:hypothetical protein